MIDAFINQLNLLSWGMVVVSMFSAILTSIIGIGGALIVGVFLRFSEFDDFSRVIYQTIVIASNCLMAVIFYYFGTEKKIDFRLVASILPGALVGVFLGFFVLYNFSEITSFSGVMYVFILSSLGVHGLYLRLTKEDKHIRKGLKTINRHLPFKIEMEALSFPVSYVLMFVLCFLIYTVSTVVGLGGNLMLLPLLVYFLGVKSNFLIPSALTTALFANIASASLELTFFASKLSFPLIISLLIGSVLGAFIGVKISKYVTLKRIKLAIPITMLILAFANFILNII